MGEWKLERGDDAGDAAALATIFFQDSGDQAMRNQVSCIVPGRVRVPLPAALCGCLQLPPYACLQPPRPASHLLCLPGDSRHTPSSST
jgi:hypothetical protein